MTVAPGTELLGKYRILELVSETRYLEIYAVEHLILGRSLQAVLLREEVAARPGVAERLLQVGVALANQREPQLLDIYESVEIPGRVGLVTEVPPTEGRTLAEAMAVSAEVWSPNRIRKQVVPCLRALARLHHYGLVHGALGPRSFIRDSQNVVRLTDLVHIRLESPRLTARRPPPLDDVRYIAPEWFADFDEVNSSADIYSVGCILYELATGQPPFMLEDPRAMMSAHLAERPREPRQVRPSVPDGIERIILRALSKHPLYRFESADAMADALAGFERFLAPIPVGAAPWEQDDTELSGPDTEVIRPTGVESGDAEEAPDSSAGESDEDSDTIKEAIAAVDAVADVRPVAELSAEAGSPAVTGEIQLPDSEARKADSQMEIRAAEENGAVEEGQPKPESSDEAEGGPAEAEADDAASAQGEAEDTEVGSGDSEDEGPPGADGTVLRQRRDQVVVISASSDDAGDYNNRSGEEAEEALAGAADDVEADLPDAEDDEEPRVPRSREDIPISQQVLVGEPSPVLAKRRRRRWVLFLLVVLVGAGGFTAWYFLRPALGSNAAVTVDRNYEDIETLMLFEPGEEMEVIPAGPVLVGGRPHPELWEGNQLPLRTVSLASFAIDRSEVSAGEYRRCVEAGACSEPGYPDRPLDLKPDEPVRGVSWNDAAAYCSFAEKRLPSEAEWEAAARGRTNRFFPWGDVFQCRRANVDAPECQRPAAKPEPAAGGEIGESPWGVTRMAGNVWEWTADNYVEPEWLDTVHGEDAPAPDGRGKVIKGGDWASPPRAIGWRAWNPADIRDPHGGFRCARTITDGIDPASDKALGGTGSPNRRLSGYLMGGEYHPLTARPLKGDAVLEQGEQE